MLKSHLILIISLALIFTSNVFGQIKPEPEKAVTKAKTSKQKVGNRNFYDEADALFGKNSKSKIKNKNRVSMQLTHDTEFEK